MTDKHILNITAAVNRLSNVVVKTALQRHDRLSEKYGCNVFLKREDQQVVRSYKIRGAYNKISSLSKAERKKGIVCASAGNHAQGVAYSCKALMIYANVFMPLNTPLQKIERVIALGGSNVTITLAGNEYDDCAAEAMAFSKARQCNYIPPFDDLSVIEGQGTIGYELLKDLAAIDYVFMPVGGGGLAAGLGYYFRLNSKLTKLIGVEPEGAASMSAAIVAGKPIALDKINPFIDGAAVKKVGQLTFDICKETLYTIKTVAEGKVCATLLSLYNEDGILAEPAGVLSIAALDEFADVIKGKNVVCILSGSNNDSNRMDEIKKLADEWEGLQHYLIIRFQHNPDGLRDFFSSILGKEDYVNRIEYVRREHGRSTYALVGVKSSHATAFEQMKLRMLKRNIEFKLVAKEDFLFKYWV